MIVTLLIKALLKLFDVLGFDISGDALGAILTFIDYTKQIGEIINLDLLFDTFCFALSLMLVNLISAVIFHLK